MEVVEAEEEAMEVKEKVMKVKERTVVVNMVLEVEEEEMINNVVVEAVRGGFGESSVLEVTVWMGRWLCRSVSSWWLRRKRLQRSMRKL